MRGIEALRKQLRGEAATEGDPGYDASRSLWNAVHDRRPAIVVQCADAPDVAAAVRFARENGMSVAVRGGGHNVGGLGACDAGLLLDMSGMKSVQVNPAKRTVQAGPGVKWGEFDAETQRFGLATTGGICSRTGIAGVTLGGGFGWLMRAHGLSLDNVVSLDAVTADGERHTASADENPDLFFGFLGTQSNLGVVTRFEYRLHPLGPMVIAGMVLHPLERGREALRFYREYTSQAPDEMSAWAALLTTPDGARMVAILGCYAGELEAAERVVEPLRRFGPPVADMLGPMPYLKAQSLLDGNYPPGRRHYWKSGLFDVLGDKVIDALVDGYAAAASGGCAILIEHLGGAVSRVPVEQTAFPHRHAAYDVVMMPMWTASADTEAHTRWADDTWAAVRPCSNGGVYVNYLGNEGSARIRSAYGPNFERLLSLKNRYDPDNVFRWNQNLQRG